MRYIDVDHLINHCPLSLLHMSEDVKKGVKEKYFHYETPIINSDSCLYNMKTIKYYLEEYFFDTERLMDEYIDANHPYDMANDTFDLTYICEIYIQRVCEGIEEKPKKVLSFRDSDGPYPTYFLEGIRPKFFRLPFKIYAKVYLFIIDRAIL